MIIFFMLCSKNFNKVYIKSSKYKKIMSIIETVERTVLEINTNAQKITTKCTLNHNEQHYNNFRWVLRVETTMI